MVPFYDSVYRVTVQDFLVWTVEDILKRDVENKYYVQLPRLDLTGIRRPVRVNRAEDYLSKSLLLRNAKNDRLAEEVITVG